MQELRAQLQALMQQLQTVMAENQQLKRELEAARSVAAPSQGAAAPNPGRPATPPREFDDGDIVDAQHKDRPREPLGDSPVQPNKEPRRSRSEGTRRHGH